MFEVENSYTRDCNPNYLALSEAQNLYNAIAVSLNERGNEYLNGLRGKNLTSQERVKRGNALLSSCLEAADKGMVVCRYQLAQIKLETESIGLRVILDILNKP